MSQFNAWNIIFTQKMTLLKCMHKNDLILKSWNYFTIVNIILGDRWGKTMMQQHNWPEIVAVVGSFMYSDRPLAKLDNSMNWIYASIARLICFTTLKNVLLKKKMLYKINIFSFY